MSARHPLRHWTVARLRLAIGIFFISLLLPTGYLLVYAYSQLKWEAFHQERVLAEELVKRIERRFAEVIDAENARPFTDYSFLNVSGNQKSNMLHRSPLSQFPVQGSIPGILGYFQIDQNGKFSTPLLPSQRLANVSNVGITGSEFDARRQAHNNIYQLLSGNNLVANKSNSPENEVDKAIAKLDGKIRTDISEKLDARIGADNFGSENKDQSWLSSSSVSSTASEDQAAQDIVAEAPSSYMPQAAFDELSNSGKNQSSPKLKQSLGRVDDLKLSKQYEQQARSVQKKAKTEERKSFLKKSPRRLRKEQNQLPQQALAGMKDQSKAEERGSVKMFESEIDAMDFSVLDSGHYVLFRKVWKNGQRLIQGVLFEPDAFIDNLIRPAFYDSALSNGSDLTVAYSGNILTVLAHREQRDYWSKPSELQGVLLLEARLLDPFSGISLVFSARQVPLGASAGVLNWLAAILTFVLCGGFYLLYRLGLKQLLLAQQQQDFISAVSHELKTPLTSIRMYGEMLMQGWMEEDKKKQYYAYIYDESERLSRLINNVLQMARMTRNDLHLELKPYSAQQLLDTLRSKVSSQIERAGFEFNLIAADDFEAVAEVDLDYFVQIIINLVDNALKFSNKAELKRIEVSCEIANNKMQWHIRDFGPGIAKGQMKKIFGLFYRSENELTRETLGTGIGLALVSELCQAMNGSIDVVNKEPGAEFVVAFPLQSH